LTFGVGSPTLGFTSFEKNDPENVWGINIMATYISLVQFTDKGIQAAKETTERVSEWVAKVESKGVTLKQMYWTLGQYDQVCIFDAPDDETAASVLLAADMLGNIRTQTLRAFTASEMEKILAKVPWSVSSGIAGLVLCCSFWNHCVTCSPSAIIPLSNFGT
jgi:uncharacterized protein with GYD domain